MLHSGNSQKDMGYFTVTLGYVGIDGDKKSDRLLLLVSPHFPLRLVRPSAHTGIVFDLSFSCHFGANSLNSKLLSFPLLFSPNFCTWTPEIWVRHRISRTEPQEEYEAKKRI